MTTNALDELREKAELHQQHNTSSLGEASLNTQLAAVAANVIKVIEKHGGQVDLASMSDFKAPSYDQYIQDDEGEGFPPSADEFHRRVLANDAFVISSPEYNSSLLGPLQNAIDWVSRFLHESHTCWHPPYCLVRPQLVCSTEGD
jgi:NAD(P)H-dependent FMN reductase